MKKPGNTALICAIVIKVSMKVSVNMGMPNVALHLEKNWRNEKLKK